MRWEQMSWDKVRRAQMRWSVECEECSVKCGAWRVQSEVWSVKKAMKIEKCEVWSVKCEVWSVKCEVWIGKSAVWSEKCGVWSVKCAVWSVKSAVRSVKGEVELQMWHVKQDTTFAECTHARAWLAHGACKFYRWERSYIYIYIFKATSAPPRAGTTGIMCVDLVYVGLRSPLRRDFPKFNPHFAHQAQPGQPSGSPKSPEKMLFLQHL